MRHCGGKAHGVAARGKSFKKSVFSITGIPENEYQVFPCRIYDPKGNLKRTITVAEIVERPVPEGQYRD